MNDPDDNGKETYKGVSRKWHPDWTGWRIIDEHKKLPQFPFNLTENKELQNLVAAFYEENFWDKIKGDFIPYQRVADELFDSAVNLGAAVAVQILEASLNILNRNGASWPDEPVDGIMDARLLDLLHKLPTGDVDFLMRAMNAYQGARYIRICENNKSQERFFRGWIKRAS